MYIKCYSPEVGPGVEIYGELLGQYITQESLEIGIPVLYDAVEILYKSRQRLRFPNHIIVTTYDGIIEKYFESKEEMLQDIMIEEL